MIPAFWSLGWLWWHMAKTAKDNSSFPSGTFLKILTLLFKALPWLLHEKPLIPLMYQSVDTNIMMRNPTSALCQEASWNLPGSWEWNMNILPFNSLFSQTLVLCYHWQHLDTVIITKLVTSILLLWNLYYLLPRIYKLSFKAALTMKFKIQAFLKSPHLTIPYMNFLNWLVENLSSTSLLWE